jgi:hypothetical protein
MADITLMGAIANITLVCIFFQLRRIAFALEIRNDRP